MPSTSGKLRQIGKVDRALANEVRQALVDTLFMSSTSLGVGAIACAVAGAAIAYRVQDPWIGLVSVALSLVGALRLAHATFFYGPEGYAPRASVRSETLYEVGAWTYAALLGMLTLFTITRSDEVFLHMLAAVVTTGYAAGISGRNAGRPAIAIGQLTLSALPLSIAMFLQASPLHWVMGAVNVLFILAMVDITLQTYSAVLKAMSATQDQARLAAKFERLARFDPMTGLENRGAFHERLETALADASASGEQLAILWIDLDKFKEINDSLGHPTGDGVLCTVARQLSAIIDQRGCVARFGGDEFVLLATGKKPGFAEDLAREVLRGLSLPMTIEGVSIQVSGSIGIAVAPDHGTESDILLQHADMALYQAKSEGRNGFCLFEIAIQERFHELRNLEAALRVAIENDELEVYYQPIVDLKSGEIRCCEALLRWHHPELGPVSPARFIPVAESTGLISPISHWCSARPARRRRPGPRTSPSRSTCRRLCSRTCICRT